MSPASAKRPSRRCPVSTCVLSSGLLGRDVRIDIYMPDGHGLHPAPRLLLVNDGQDLPVMGFDGLLQDFCDRDAIGNLMAVGIHAGPDRKQEYGTAGRPDYLSRGSKADAYTGFVFKELLPFLRRQTGIPAFSEKAFCGFSLGGLMAMDIVWNNPHEFNRVGVFSGSFWWRTRALDDGYDEHRDRIMHALVRGGKRSPWLRFFFQAGLLDEKADRNNNGVIDSVDDTRDLIAELRGLGYGEGDIRYLELEDGRHDIATWGRAFPEYLDWAYGKR